MHNCTIKQTYQWQWVHKVVNVGHASSCNDFIHRHLATIITVLNVLTNAAVKQDWFLWDKADLRAQPLNAKLSDITTIDHLQYTIVSHGAYAFLWLVSANTAVSAADHISFRKSFLWAGKMDSRNSNTFTISISWERKKNNYPQEKWMAMHTVVCISG